MSDFDSEETMMNILHELISSRNNFLNSESIRALNYNDRSNIVSRFMTNELCLLEVANRVYSNHYYNRIRPVTAYISLAMPPNTFADPVTVTASQNQITRSMENVAGELGNCSICQDAINGNGSRLVFCRHAFHRSCILEWFGMSVRCPVCRHDIREEGPATQTSSASSETSSLQTNQSEEL
jgi:hypothetical protein